MFPNQDSGCVPNHKMNGGLLFCLPWGWWPTAGPWGGTVLTLCLAPGLQDLASPVCSVDPATVETNIVLVRVSGLPPAELCRRLQAVSADEVAQTGCAVSVLLFPWTAHSVRVVWHRDVSAQDTELALRKWEFVLRQLQP